MCGILGGFGKGVDFSALESSLATIFHRGPDNQGFRALPGECFMGVARLAMTDPHPRSNQPLVAHDGRWAISFNGEIFNFKQLRRDLEVQGISFVTQSDTEVLMETFRRNGIHILDRLEGMFAFAVYDIDNEILTLARDRLGKKPLYYTFQDNRIYWSSSVVTLKNLIAADFEIDDATYDFISLGYQLDPNTGYKEIRALLPGHYLEINKTLLTNEPRKFPAASSKQSRAGSLREVLWKAIEVRIEGHEKIGLSLSGGIDSTLVALGLKELGVKADAFSAYWSNSDKSRYNSDKEHAEKIANILHHNFNPIDISSDFDLRKEVTGFLAAMEEPNNNPSGLSTVRLYKAIHERQIKLLLTGDGSDEIFGGYARHELASKFPQILSLKTSLFDDLLYSRSNTFQRTVSNIVASQLFEGSAKFWLHWHLVFTPKETSALLNNIVSADRIEQKLIENIESISDTQAESNRTQNLMQRDHEVWLSMESNKKLDRISMAFSIEARSPFQDENVIKFAELAMKRTNYKVLNKKILRDEFPELKNLPVKTEKVGFTSPVGHWMRESSKFVNESIEYLSNRQEFNASYLEKYRDAQFRGDYRTNMQLWTLFIYANWLMVQNEN
jgi:asparagine synthase (glutamine-hydrolysing)